MSYHRKEVILNRLSREFKGGFKFKFKDGFKFQSICNLFVAVGIPLHMNKSCTFPLRDPLPSSTINTAGSFVNVLESFFKKSEIAVSIVEFPTTGNDKMRHSCRSRPLRDR